MPIASKAHATHDPLATPPGPILSTKPGINHDQMTYTGRAMVKAGNKTAATQSRQRKLLLPGTLFRVVIVALPEIRRLPIGRRCSIVAFRGSTPAATGLAPACYPARSVCAVSAAAAMPAQP